MRGPNLPYEFVLDHLPAERVEIKPMFGHQCVYFDGLMVVFMISKDDSRDNGVCIATSKEHIESLQEDIKSLRHLNAYGPKATNWRLIPVDSESFESDVERACRLILKGDPRIGREPNSAKKKPSKETRRRRN